MFGGGVSFLSNTLKKNKKLLTVTVILIVTVFIVLSGKSYAYFEERVDGSCVSLEVGSLAHTLKSEVTVAAGENTKIKVVVSNVDNVASKYQLVYSSQDDLKDVVVGYSNTSIDLPYGDLTKDGEKYVTVIIQNNSTSEITVYVDVRGGLPANSVEDIILEEGENRINLEVEEPPITIDDIILAQVDEFAQIDFSKISSVTNGRGIYKYEEDGTDIYYWRGAVTNNHVIFAGYCWEMVRTTKTGGIKMIYDGTPVEVDGVKTCPNTEKASQTNDHKRIYLDDNTFVGYMNGLFLVSKISSPLCIKSNSAGTQAEVGTETTEVECVQAGGKWATTEYEATHANLIDSELKKEVDKWFVTSNLNTVENLEKLEDAIYCSDRSISSGLGYNQYRTFYGLRSDDLPNLECINKNDRFTVSKENGNGDLTYPVGLLTADEIFLAGGVYDTINKDYYLYTGENYWTMSPFAFVMEEEGVMMYGIDSVGRISWYVFNDELFGIRPVISLVEGTMFKSGTAGTVLNPYIVQ